MKNGIIVLTLLLAFGIASCDSNTSETKTKSIANETETRSIAKEAHIFAYPLVMNYRAMYMQAIKSDETVC